MLDTFVVYAATYPDEASAVADYDAVKDLYAGLDIMDTFDAAVVSRHDDGKVKILKKHEEPTRHGAVIGAVGGLAVGVVAALFPPVTLAVGLLAGGVSGAVAGAVAGHIVGGMSRHDLADLGDHLDAGTAALVVVAATDLESRVEEALAAAEKLEKKQLNADRSRIEKELAAEDEAAEVVGSPEEASGA